MELAESLILILKIANPESTRHPVKTAVLETKILSVSHLGSNPVCHSGFNCLAFHKRHHPLGNVHSDYLRPFCGRFCRRNCGISCTTRHIEDILRRPIHNILQRMSTPYLIHIQRHYMVEFVIGGGNRVEH